MIIRHSRSNLLRCRITLQFERPHDRTRPTIGLQHDRRFHASKPNLIVNEALQLSSSLFYFIHDTSGLSWGLSIPLTAGLCQLAFTPLHYMVDRNRNLRAKGTTLLAAYRTAFQEQVLAQKENIGTETDARRAESQTKSRLKVKSKDLQRAIGYRRSWLNFLPLSYVPLWLSNVSALVDMCGINEEDSKVIAASGLSGVSNEPALTTDGILWFTDLTIADPVLLLPIAAGGLFLTSVLVLRPNPTEKPTRLQMVLITFSLCSAPLFIATGVSNAVLLAMMGSTAVTIVRRLALERLFDDPTAKVKPARPRTAVLKEQYRV